MAAEVALTQAVTRRAASVLLDQYNGSLEQELADIVRLLADRDVRAPRAPGEPLREAAARTTRLLELAPLGLHLTEPWNVVLGGRANVGKSSLVNALVGFERVVVDHQPGTTRDVVTQLAALDGWPVLLSDTAGFRRQVDDLETAGIAHALESLRNADLRVLVLDRSRPLSQQDDGLIRQWPDAILVANKADLPDRAGKRLPTRAHEVSAKTGEGVEDLAVALGRALVPDPPPAGAAVPFRADQVDRLRQARELIAHGNAADTRASLEELLNGGRH
jgi:tRNA modification GTPase